MVEALVRHAGEGDDTVSSPTLLLTSVHFGQAMPPTEKIRSKYAQRIIPGTKGDGSHPEFVGEDAWHQGNLCCRAKYVENSNPLRLKTFQPYFLLNVRDIGRRDI